ncbi:Ig-like domain-containing protein [Pelotomaculum terephthalicicum JT]|uniref:Ig-like domain-containing protein n=1 Tax=Pelotomaculum terephthalicicum TaxID=206393 RepID=UPI001F041A17|nr:Ig-like domain-containing protein [Pelotomaculum terephthalicicum]MCG9967277.1 Ig-like domain-containing protein [Pelotomaculum terephthalicicum JT]
MQPIQLVYKQKNKKFLSFLVILSLLCNFLWMALPGPAGAKTESNAPAPYLEIKTGYLGGTYTHVQTFQRSDLEAMQQVQQAYSFIDNMPCPVIDSAVGVKLTDILAACSVDVDNAVNFRFWTTDSGSTYYETLTKSYLLDTPRYYFPHLADDWNANTGEIAFPDPVAAAAGAVEVPTILAIRDNWQREFTPLQPDFSNLDDTKRFRLVFGKTNDLAAAAPEHTASKSAKWVYRIDVTLNGTPVSGVALDKTSDTLCTGATGQLTATVAPAGATNQNVAWASDNTAVATVDSNGLVTAVAPGAANITVTTADGGFTASCAVTVSNEIPVLTTLSLSGSPYLNYGGTPTAYDLNGLSLTGQDQNGAAFDLTGQTVNWSVISGPAAVSGSTLTITGSGTINISATAGGVISNTLGLNVNASAAVLTTLNLSGSPSLSYGNTPFAFDLGGLTLAGKDQNGDDFSLGGQTVTWSVISGPAAVSGSTLLITGTGTVNISAMVSGVTSNTLGLNVLPASLPGEVILSWTEDPQTTQTISWRTADTAPEMVQYLPAAGFNGSFDGALAADAAASYLYTDDYNDVYHEEATLRGLNPNTSYVYRVGREGAWSETASFTTAGADNSFSFLYMGDVQTGYTNWGNMLNVAGAENPAPKFALLGGDLVDDGANSYHWEQFFAAATPLFKQIPLMPVAGNHDDVTDTLFWNSFALPHNGPDGYKERVFSFDYGNCHFVGLDSCVLTAPGTDAYNSISAWLLNDLNNSDKTWKFVYLHYPPYPAVYDSHAANLQANWAPVFEQCEVDAAFVGHQHVYMRTKPIEAGQVATDGNGIVYVMGNAGTSYFAPGDNLDYIAKEIAYVSNYELINIDGNTFTLTTKDANGQVIDSYVMTKNAAPITLSVEPSSATLDVGGTQAVCVTTDPADAVLSYASDNMSVATVSAGGIISAVAPGSATISVTAEKAGYTTATVNVPVTVYAAPSTDTAVPVWPAGNSLSAAVSADGQSVSLTWSAATDNTGVTGYRVYRNGTPATPAPVNGTSYNITGLAADTQYTFRVTAGDAAGNWTVTGPSATVITTTPSSDRSAPYWPAGSSVTASGITNSGLTLNWSTASDNVGVTSYRITQNGTRIATVDGTTSYSITGLSANTRYTFRITAGDAAGNWSRSSVYVTVTTP